MIKNNKTINTIALCYALFQFSTMLIASSQTNYNNAFVTFYQKLNNTTDASVANAANFIFNKKHTYSWSATQGIANDLKTNEAETTGLYLTQNPSSNKNKFAGAITDLTFQDIEAALNNAQKGINPTTSTSAGSSNPNTGSSTSAGSSNPSTGSSGSTGSSQPQQQPQQSLTATDTAAAQLFESIKNAIKTYNQYLASLNKGIPALAVPTVPAGVPLVG
ncbi:MAG: hypothetical protein ACXWL2_00775 [Candidatus Chromulinivorax sp.]